MLLIPCRGQSRFRKWFPFWSNGAWTVCPLLDSTVFPRPSKKPKASHSNLKGGNYPLGLPSVSTSAYVNTVGDTILMWVKPWFSSKAGKDFRKRENGGKGYYLGVGKSVKIQVNRNWIFDRGYWMIFRVKSHPVFLFWDQIREKCSLRNRFDRIRGEENRFWFSNPSS